jgi:hypothetical protein
LASAATNARLAIAPGRTANSEGCLVNGSHQRAESLGIKNALEGADKYRNQPDAQNSRENDGNLLMVAGHERSPHRRELTLALAAASIHGFV